MKHLDFILWTLLFPICMSILEYIDAKTREITKEPKKIYSDETNNKYIIFIFFIWFFIAYKLF